ncbi:MAG: FAD/NAD(P)-binding protein [Bacteroidota bacterium]
MNDNNKQVAIVGGGFCGMMTAVQLVKAAAGAPCEILLFTDGELGKGPAYSGSSDLHVLNVEARNMSAFPEAPEHFADWLVARLEKAGMSTENADRMFAPRKWYGEYLSEIAKTLRQEHGSTKVKIIHRRVLSVKPLKNGFGLTTIDSNHAVDCVVLATGNMLPSKPKGIPASFQKSTHYVSDPWSFDSAVVPADQKTVLIVGTGLTMVDVMITLREGGFNGRIVAVSPKGFEILPHRKYQSISAIKDELHPPYRLDDLFALFRKHIRIVREKGITGEAVVDAVRPLTRSIWTSLTESDKRRFLTHLRHLWGLARHRLPPEQHEQLREQITQGSFTILAGRILDVHEEKDGCLVTIKERKTGLVSELSAALVINCTGPSTDIAACKDPLYESLLKEHIIRPDPLGMGIQANHLGHPMGKDQEPVAGIYALGSLLKGTFWESTAIPELRVQCKETAESVYAYLKSMH